MHRQRQLARLLAAVYANPADDAARLVYADALQSLGDPRGEYIALQLHPAAGTKTRERQLLREHATRWLGSLAPVVIASTFARGFLVEVVIDVARGNELRRVAKDPVWSTVELVRLGGGRRSLGTDFAKQQLAAITLLENAPGARNRQFAPTRADIAARVRSSKALRASGTGGSSGSEASRASRARRGRRARRAP